MPTATPFQPPHTQARNFALRGVAWSLGLFGLVRLGWFESHAVLPLTQLQGRIAEAGFGIAASPIQITLACSGADALSLCAGAILAYPARWRIRLAGAAGGIALILALNTVRIGTLGQSAASPHFETLHLYLWPGLLTLAVAGYVFGWMRFADRPRGIAPATTSPVVPTGSGSGTTRLTRRFVGIAAVLLLVFTAAAPLYAGSAAVLAMAALVARAAAAALGLLGVDATASANMLSTARGAFLVTEECISTPLIPVYLAAVFAYLPTWPRRAAALAAAVPLFIGLGIARLLVVALPAALVGSPVFLIHAFTQLVVAGIVVAAAALWRHGAGAAAGRRALLGAALGAAFVYFAGPLYTQVLSGAFAWGAPLDDPQGAVRFLPAFQVGLYAALCVAGFVMFNWRLAAAGLAALGVSQVVVLAVLHLLARQAMTPHVREVRAWALAGPLLIVAAMVSYERSRR